MRHDEIAQHIFTLRQNLPASERVVGQHNTLAEQVEDDRADVIKDHCTHVAMEATGVYWKPVWHILSDGDFTLILANAAHVKNVAGARPTWPTHSGWPNCWRMA